MTDAFRRWKQAITDLARIMNMNFPQKGGICDQGVRDVVGTCCMTD
jgi:hypothetical protein